MNPRMSNMLAAATGFFGDDVALKGAGAAGSFAAATFPEALLATVFVCWGPAPAARISRYASRSSSVKAMESDARTRVFFWGLETSEASGVSAARSAGLGDIFIEILPPFLAFLSSFGSAGLGDGLSRTFWEVFFAGAGFGGVLKTVFFAPAAGFADGFFAGAFCPEAAGFFAAAFPGAPETAAAPLPCEGFAAGFLFVFFAACFFVICFATLLFCTSGKCRLLAGREEPSSIWNICALRLSRRGLLALQSRLPKLSLRRL